MACAGRFMIVFKGGAGRKTLAEIATTRISSGHPRAVSRLGLNCLVGMETKAAIGDNGHRTVKETRDGNRRDAGIDDGRGIWPAA
jgi:hypothetical protein